ncbi:MAG: methylmalonyl Co-A mutase-associated GTPase MeaB [Deltaproteobacteria bacterium]|nr:methylmalonyl Co-A mutase-associated GTPase MeaB [Deltaproteobacteria bacterium]
MSNKLLQDALKQDQRALAQLLTVIEERGDGAREAMAHIYDHLQGARVVGVTGPPGSGKSTLISECLKLLRSRNETVAVVAIDPSSPLSGGALLGDRIRMMESSADHGVFIRSLASRGFHGGLSRATRDVVTTLDAAGFQWIFVETVGVGQGEFDIAGLAETTILVLVPESGDTIQTMKAGVMEIADLFVVNKNDRDGAGELAQEIRAQSPSPVLLTTASMGKGIEEVLQGIEVQRAKLAHDEGHRHKQRELRKTAFLELLRDELTLRVLEKMKRDQTAQDLVDDVASGKQNPYRALEPMLKRL